MFYKICKYESSAITNDVIITSLPKTVAKFGPPRKQTNYMSIVRHWRELSKNVLFIESESLCQKLWVFLSNFGFFLQCPLTKYGHVTWPKKRISTKFLFCPNSTFNIMKSHKISSELLFTSEVISQKPWLIWYNELVWVIMQFSAMPNLCWRYFSIWTCTNITCILEPVWIAKVSKMTLQPKKR